MSQCCNISPQHNDIKWSDICTYFDTIGRKVVNIPSNGKCLLLAIKECLDVDFDIKRDEKNIACKIWQELKDSFNYYADFTTQNATDLLNDAQQYLSMKRNTYTLEVVDVIVCAAANALNLNYSRSMKDF